MAQSIDILGILEEVKLAMKMIFKSTKKVQLIFHVKYLAHQFNLANFYNAVLQTSQKGIKKNRNN